MNYLAHAFLAGDNDALRLGGLMGDFVKGPLPAGLPEAVAAGVALHRQIDSFADTHPAFRRSRERVSPPRRRYAGILVDMFYDHLLARSWERFHPAPLEAFADAAYTLLEDHAPLLPERLTLILPAMRRNNWLASYAEGHSIALALERMAVHRLRRPNPLAGGLEELLADEAGFEADFQHFIRDARAFARARADHLSTKARSIT